MYRVKRDPERMAICLRILDLILKKGVDINSPEKTERKRPVEVAVEKDRDDLIQLFAEHGPDFSLKSRQQQGRPDSHALQAAAQRQHNRAWPALYSMLKSVKYSYCTLI
mmetsp:Transcript_7887/g.19332  ORF Transcript_7887/g.19332 Transcript_7887/m.19332 type:complete len:109 (-) Transcript_7887:20-346(-)